MRANERINQLEPTLRGAIEGYLTELWTALPGIVEKFDGEEMTVEVKSALTFQYRDQHNELQPISMPNLIHVPVICMTGGGYSLTFPVKQGDEVLVVFACRCIDQWWGFSGVQPQAEFRLHDISDGFAIIGPRSKPRALPSYSTNSVQLRSDDGSCYIEMDANGRVNIKSSGGVYIDGELHVSGNIAAQGDVTAMPGNISLAHHTHTSASSGSPTSPPIATGTEDAPDTMETP